MMIFMLTMIVIIAVSMCWTLGVVLGTLLNVILLNPYHNPARCVSLLFHFTGGKTGAPKVVQSHGDNKRQNKDSELSYCDYSREMQAGQVFEDT